MAKILVVDDDPDTRDVYNEVLQDAGYDVEFATDGKMGLGKILLGGYDLILLDIMMPKIDGLGVLRYIQKNPPTVYNGPTFVLSALNSEQVIKEALSLGARGYFVKSDFTPDQLLDKISQALKK